jgi:metal-responsive CopG/Arc/MetJ family transcriptional regulator
MQDDSKIPVNARYDQSLLERLDDWRRRQPKIPARSEALRELVRRALNAEEEPA